MKLDLSNNFFPLEVISSLMNLHLISRTTLANPKLFGVSQWAHWKERTLPAVDVFPLSKILTTRFNVDDFLLFRSVELASIHIQRLSHWVEGVDVSCPSVAFTCLLSVGSRGMHKMTTSLLHGSLNKRGGSEFILLNRPSKPGECRSTGAHVHFETTMTFAPRAYKDKFFKML